ncbi:hypothetical protein EfmE1039_0536 [Enterococcus faecium E1039]|nr:hypothetical protein EfmE1039_0536 [Enterococcus faecium E1039]
MKNFPSKLSPFYYSYANLLIFSLFPIHLEQEFPDKIS